VGATVAVCVGISVLVGAGVLVGAAAVLGWSATGEVAVAAGAEGVPVAGAAGLPHAVSKAMRITLRKVTMREFIVVVLSSIRPIAMDRIEVSDASLLIHCWLSRPLHVASNSRSTLAGSGK